MLCGRPLSETRRAAVGFVGDEPSYIDMRAAIWGDAGGRGEIRPARAGEGGRVIRVGSSGLSTSSSLELASTEGFVTGIGGCVAGPTERLLRPDKLLFIFGIDPSGRVGCIDGPSESCRLLSPVRRSFAGSAAADNEPCVLSRDSTGGLDCSGATVSVGLLK